MGFWWKMIGTDGPVVTTQSIGSRARRTVHTELIEDSEKGLHTMVLTTNRNGNIAELLDLTEDDLTRLADLYAAARDRHRAERLAREAGG